MAPKAQQLVFAALADPEAAAPGEREYVVGVRVDRSGIARYLHLIRDPNDPDRSPRPVGGRADRAPHRTLAKLSVDAAGEEMLRLLADGRPRTFNAIGVELLDHTADTLHGSPYEKALWELTARGALEHTLDVPVLFRSPLAGKGDR
jgi:hypothetical protein